MKSLFDLNKSLDPMIRLIAGLIFFTSNLGFSQIPKPTENKIHQSADYTNSEENHFYNKGVDYTLDYTKDACEMLKGMKEGQLDDYNSEAIRKVEAFGRYLKYISNPDVPKNARIKAINMAKDLFVDGDRIIDMSKVSSISEYLGEVFERANHKAELELLNIRSKESFHSERNPKIVETEFVERWLKRPGVLKKENIFDEEIDVLLVYQGELVHSELSQILRVKLGNINLKK